MGRKIKTVIWNLSLAGGEFGCDEDTLRRKLALGNHKADAKGHYTTRQIADALYGSQHSERLALIRQQTEEKQLKNAERSGRLISIEDAEAVVGRAAAAIRSRIMASGISRDEKAKILEDINGLAKTSFADAEKLALQEDAEIIRRR